MVCLFLSVLTRSSSMIHSLSLSLLNNSTNLGFLCVFFSKKIYRLQGWEARTRHRRCRTRVRRGGTRQRAGDAAARASGRVRPRGSHVVFTDASRYGFDARRREPIRADSGLNRPYRPESAGIGRIGRNQPVSAETADSG